MLLSSHEEQEVAGAVHHAQSLERQAGVVCVQGQADIGLHCLVVVQASHALVHQRGLLLVADGRSSVTRDVAYASNVAEDGREGREGKGGRKGGEGGKGGRKGKEEGGKEREELGWRKGEEGARGKGGRKGKEGGGGGIEAVKKKELTRNSLQCQRAWVHTPG